MALKFGREFDALISIGTTNDFDASLLAELGNHPRYLHLPFDDISYHVSPQDAERMGLVHPSFNEIKLALRFVKLNETTRIHCHAGVSRIPAVAILAAHKLGYPEGEILDALSGDRISPNAMVLNRGEEVLARNDGSILGPILGRLGRDLAPIDEDGLTDLEL